MWTDYLFIYIFTIKVQNSILNIKDCGTAQKKKSNTKVLVHAKILSYQPQCTVSKEKALLMSMYLVFTTNWGHNKKIKITDK